MDNKIKRGIFALLTTILILVLAAFFIQKGILAPPNKITDITGLMVADATSSQHIPIEKTPTTPVVLFCPRDNCTAQLAFLIDKSKAVNCAFFDLSEPTILNALKTISKNTSKRVRLVIDNDTKKKALLKDLDVVYDESDFFMHHKFCIFDDRIVWTGSFNPTKGGGEKSNNNVIAIASTVLAENYHKEFEQLWNKKFGKQKEAQDINHKMQYNDIVIETYFCPQDHCAEEILSELKEAKESITLMAYSFTDNNMEKVLLEKQKQDVKIQGLFEKQQLSDYSAYHALKKAGVPVFIDTNPSLMHHKVFIIDNQTVITGSMNPTRRGDEGNDENILIIHDPQIASKFLEEFERLSR